jgi:hypothetical protein
LFETAAMTILWVDSVLHELGLTLLERRRDKAYSLGDAVCFIIMQERGLTEALTTDYHVQQEGFRRLLA